MMNNPSAQVTVRRLERVIIGFFLLAVLFLLGVYIAAPSVYTSTFLLTLSPDNPYPPAITLFLVGILIFIAILIVGVRRHWRWLFWLLPIAFGASILEIPATILQLAGVIPGAPPLWYGLARIGSALVEVSIAVWMFQIYRRYGVWGSRSS